MPYIYNDPSLLNQDYSPSSRGNGHPDCREDSVSPPFTGHLSMNWDNHRPTAGYNHSQHYHHYHDNSSWSDVCYPSQFEFGLHNNNHNGDSSDLSLLQRANKRQRVAPCSSTNTSTTMLTTTSVMTTSTFPPFPLPSKNSWHTASSSGTISRFHQRRYYLNDPSTLSSSQEEQEEGFVPFPPDIQRLTLPSLLHGQFNELSQRRRLRQEFSDFSRGGTPLATIS